MRAAVACAVAIVLFGAAGAQARDVAVRGTEMNRYGRILLEFDKVNKVSARAANGILVITFAEPATIRGEKLATELRSYVATVRQDPDRTGLRLALTAPYRINLLEAGEKVIVDILPENWVGLPPGLPPDIVAELARRAREAESKLRDESARRERAVAKPINVRVAHLPTLTRLVFEPPGVVPISFKNQGREVEILFDAPLTLDRAQVAGQLAPAIRTLSVDEQPQRGLLVKLLLESGYEARGFREDEAFVIDVAKPQAAAATVFPPPLPERPLPEPEPATAPEPQTARKAAEPAPVGPAPAAPKDGPSTVAASPPRPAGPVTPVAVVTADGLKVTFPFAGRVAAAAFDRGGLLTLVFHTPESIALSGLPQEAEPIAAFRDVVRDGAFAIVRLALAKPQVSRLAPQGRDWVLTVGGGHVAASQPLPVARSVDGSGRTVVQVALPDSSGVYWIDDPEGEKIAAVTAFGGPHGLAKLQRFVEFSLLPTLHGAAVTAAADDLIVRSGLDGVTISRGSGLSVSLSGTEPGGEDLVRPAQEPAILRERWMEAQRGATLARSREILQQIAEAPRSLRGPLRIELARFLLANDLNPEAASVLAYAAVDDPGLTQQRLFSLLQGIASVRMNRLDETRKILGSGALSEDPEAILWRAVLDAQEKRWAPALAGFRRSTAVLEAYPDDLQVGLRLLAARSGLEMRDFVYADNELNAVTPLASAGSRDKANLLRARLDEALGRPDVASEAYERLTDSAERPVAAEAMLRWVELALKTGSMKPDAATARLETLSVIWRGDDIETETLGRLGRLYAQAGRWREAFLTARRANQIFPDHEVTRALHDDTSRLFEELFLQGKADSLSRVDALALYFDFKEFTPIGRRGDEIVRHLTDRLIELDLLEQAGDLLQHQVNNRLFGAARATVAARLAAVRLMDDKPGEALAALRSTRLSELPKTINRARLLLEARALSELSRTDLALEVLEAESGPEIDRLRGDILWSGRRWREAGEAHEKMVGTRWQGPAALSDQNRADVMRAAIAYSLADEPLALDRLRAKFATKMADSADARTFSFLTQPNIASTRAFRELARAVTSADTLADFLAEYRKRYPEAATAQRPRRPGLQPAGPERPQAQAPEAAPTPRS